MKYVFKELVGTVKLQKLLDDLQEMMAMPLTIVTLDGEVLAKSGWQRVCTDFHHHNPAAKCQCLIFNPGLCPPVNPGESFTMQECPFHLTSAWVPIRIGQKHVANFLCGQFLVEPPKADLEQAFREQAQKFGFDEAEYLKALHEVPVIPVERVVYSLKWLTKLAQLIGKMGLARQQQREAIAETQASRQQFFDIIDFSPDAIISINQQGEIIHWNRAATELLGWSAEEILGKPVDTLIPPIYLTAHNEGLKRALAEGKIKLSGRPLQLQALHRDKRTVSVELTLSRWHARNGTYFTANLRDVRERLELESERLIAQSQYQTLFREMIDGVARQEIICNEQGQPVDYRYLAINPAFERFTGLTAEKLIGRTVLEVMPQTEPFWIETYGKVALKGELAHFEHYSQVLDRHFEVTAFCPEHRQFVTIFVDKTEEHRREKQLRASEERLQLALYAANLGIWDWDLKTNRTQWSDGHLSIFGLTRATFDERYETFFDLIRPSDREGLTAAIEKARQNRAEYDHEYRIQWRDGSEHWVSARGHFIYDEQGQAIRMLGVVRDISSQKHLEAQLRQSQKLESIGQLAGGIAHDFNNILGSFMMHMDLLHSDVNASPETKQTVRDLYQDAKRASGIVRQLLAFSRKQDLHAQTLDLNEIVPEILKVLRRLLGEHIELIFAPTQRPTLVNADPGMMEQIIMNLCINARDAMPGGGTLKLSIASVKLDNTDATLPPSASPGPYAQLAVEDTGTGMNTNTLNHIFEPFFTTKDVGKGTGLGLSTVHGIVQQHRGWVTVTSTVGQGSIFTVFLPLVKTSVPPPAMTNDLDTLPRGTETVLLAEDDKNLRRAFTLMLRRLGYEVIEAEDGILARELWEKNKDRIKLLLTDNNMPKGISGTQLASQLRTEKPGLPVIICTGYNTDTAGRALVAEDGVHHLPKPCPPAKLAQTVRAALDAKR